MTRPHVTVICGSTRFHDDMVALNKRLTLAKRIVLAPGVFAHMGDTVTAEQKRDLDDLHLRKIDLADSVVVVARCGYIGESTAREIEYARRTGKPVEIWDPADDNELQAQASRAQEQAARDAVTDAEGAAR